MKIRKECIDLLKRALESGYITDAEHKDLYAKLNVAVNTTTDIEGRYVELFKYKACLLIDHILALYFDEYNKILKERSLELPPE